VCGQGRRLTHWPIPVPRAHAWYAFPSRTFVHCLALVLPIALDLAQQRTTPSACSRDVEPIEITRRGPPGLAGGGMRVP
jgi:hypothetical protein